MKRKRTPTVNEDNANLAMIQRGGLEKDKGPGHTTGKDHQRISKRPELWEGETCTEKAGDKKHWEDARSDSQGTRGGRLNQEFGCRFAEDGIKRWSKPKGVDVIRLRSQARRLSNVTHACSSRCTHAFALRPSVAGNNDAVYVYAFHRVP